MSFMLFFRLAFQLFGVKISSFYLERPLNAKTFRDSGQKPFSTFLYVLCVLMHLRTKKWKTVFDHRHEKSWHLKGVQDFGLRFQHPIAKMPI